MLDIKKLRENLDDVDASLLKRGYSINKDVFNSLDKKRKVLQIDVENLQAERKKLSLEFGKLKEAGENIDDLKKMEYELCEHLGFKKPTEKTYAEWQQHYGHAEDYEMTADEETKMHEEFGTTMITDFPELTSPFWNMSRNADGKTAKKIDVILGGMETIGSAERSCDVDMMRDTFHLSLIHI